MADIALPAPRSDRFASLGAAMPRLLPMLTGAALLLGLACRLCAGIDAPLWLDETFSAEIASQPDFPHFLRWALTEMSGPVYYGSLFLWEKIAGNSDLALRLPSLALSIAAPLAVLKWGHRDRDVRMLWSAILALSVVGFDSATEARPYALLLLLACLQTIAYVRMIDAPTTRRALAWTSLSALMVLTHYYAALICGLQGLAYLAICRGRAVRTWPALAPLVPMALWARYHLPFVLDFATSDANWYRLLQPDALWLIPLLLTGMGWPGVLLLAGMAAQVATDARAAWAGKARWPYSAGETAAAASGLAALLALLAAGFFAPTFTPRYVLPYIPAIFLGMALWVRRTLALTPLIAPVLLCALLGSAGSQLAGYIRHPEADYRYIFNFAAPSRWIAAQQPRRLLFLWDGPTALIPDPDRHMAAVGSFFLRRDGIDIPVITPPWPRDSDPNLALLQAAGGEPGTAILWAYDVNIPGTRGRAHPWRIPAIDPRWDCRDFGRGPVALVACIRR